jgi:predicted amidohydrolase YtcJ
MIQKGVNMHFGSDGMPTSALFGIWSATHHPNPKERISFEQALSAYSLMSAEYEHKHDHGRIAEGAPADIVVVNRETLNEMVAGEGDPAEFEKMGADAETMNNKVAKLEAGVARVYSLIDK